MWLLSAFIHISLQARRRIASTVKAIIEERRKNSSASSTQDNTRSFDFLEILLCVDALSEDEKVSFVLDSLLGGYETTSLLMAMVVHFLDQSTTALEHLKVAHYLQFSPLIYYISAKWGKLYYIRR